MSLQNAAQRKRRLGGGRSDQSGEDEVELPPAAPAPKRAAASSGVSTKPRVAPAPAAAHTEEPVTSKPAPKSVEEIRREKRLQRFAAAQTSSVGTASAGPQSSSKATGRRHAPIVFQPEQLVSSSPPSPLPGAPVATPVQPGKAAPSAVAPVAHRQPAQQQPAQQRSVTQVAQPTKKEPAGKAQLPADDGLELNDDVSVCRWDLPLGYLQVTPGVL
jgi:hypothetical protein